MNDYLSKDEIRRDPDSEEAQEESRQHERDVFAAQMQHKYPDGLPQFEDEDYCDNDPRGQLHQYAERIGGVECVHCGHFVGNWE